MDKVPLLVGSLCELNFKWCMKTKRIYERLSIFIISLLIITVITIIVLSLFQSRRVNETAALVGHTQSVLIKTESLGKLMTENESATRAYLITVQQEYIDNLNHSTAAINKNLRELKELLKDNPVQRKRLDSLIAVINSRIGFSNMIVGVRNSVGLDSTVAIARRMGGKSYSAEIKRLITNVEMLENKLLAERQSLNRSNISILHNILAIVIIIFLALLVFMIKRIWDDYRQKRQTALELFQLNTTLEERIVERTNELFHSRNTLEETLDRITDGFISLDSNWNYTHANKYVGMMLHRDPAGLIGKNVWAEYPDVVNSETYKSFHKAMEEQVYVQTEDYYPGLGLWQENRIYPSKEGIFVFIRDITEKKRSDEKLLKANRLYAFISQINQMIVRIKTEDTLYQEVCKIAVECGKFRMAWIGIIDQDTGKVIPVMFAGEENEYLSKIKIINLRDTVHYGPTEKALVHGDYIVCNDIEHDPQMAPWKEAAIDRGYRSSMALPIFKYGKVIGAFTFYASGKDFFDDAEIALLREATGDVSFALEVMENERERMKAMELILTVSHEKEVVLNRISDSVISLDANWRYTFLNDAAMETHKDDPDPVIGKSIWDVHPQMIGTEFERIYRQAMKDKQTVGYEQYYEPMNAWFSLKVYPSDDGLTIFYNDISQTRKAEHAILQAQERFNLIARATNDVIRDWDLATGKVWWNDNYHKLFGYPVHENPSDINLFYDHIYPNDRDRVLKGLEAALSSGATKWEDEYCYIAYNSDKMTVLDRGFVLYDDSGKPYRMIGSMLDITARKRSEASLKESSEQLRELTGHLITIRENERKRIGREIHDELGQQLTGIKMDIAWINKKTSPDDAVVKGKLLNVINLLDSGNASIRRILNELRPVILDDYGLVEALQWHAKQFMNTSGIPVELICNDQQLKVPEEISTCIYRVCQESLNNIVKYAHASKVVISLDIRNECVSFFISDDGNGFDLAASREKKSFGLLGMKERVHAVNGTFELSTTVGKGTEINIIIPMITENLPVR